MLKPEKWQSTFDSDGKIHSFQKALKLILYGVCSFTSKPFWCPCVVNFFLCIACVLNHSLTPLLGVENYSTSPLFGVKNHSFVLVLSYFKNHKMIMTGAINKALLSNTSCLHNSVHFQIWSRIRFFFHLTCWKP